MKGALEPRLEGWIETFAPLRELDLLPLWRRADGSQALNHPWGQRHRPDWAARGLVIWPRGGQTLRLSHRPPTAPTVSVISASRQFSQADPLAGNSE